MKIPRVRLQSWAVLALMLIAAVAVDFPTNHNRVVRAAQDESRVTPNPTYYRDILPILQKHCQMCHRTDGIAPLELETYEQSKIYSGKMQAFTRNKSMPPWFADPTVGKFLNDPSLTVQQIATIAAWEEKGAVEGDPHDAPPPMHWAESWTMPQPDVALKMAKSVTIPAEGDVEYTYEILPTHFKEDRWIQAAEILPSVRGNVHHAVAYIRPPDSKWLRNASVGVPFTSETLTNPEGKQDTHWTDSDILLVYAPGSGPGQWPTTMAKFVPAGSDIVLQMHYTTNGKAGSDQTSVGMIFAKEPPKQRILTLQLTNDHFVIPPGVPDFRVEARGTLPNDATLLGFLPHMHLRGKKFEYNIIHPAGEGGSRTQEIEPLLRVNYHFHWQLNYELAEPRFLKAGTELQAVAWYDNSRNNPHNPDPDAAVRWGDQTYDEMMVGFFDVAVEAKLDKWRFFDRANRPVH